MLIEVALIQKFILFLGEPTSAIAVSLFSLLLAGGTGSLFSKKWLRDKQYNAFKISLIIAILTIAYIFILPIVFNVTLSYLTSVRFIISFVFISPLGFLMGIPFPTILGYIKQESENDTAWMWCINGAFSVLAGIIALVIAMTLGFNAVLTLGALTYAGFFLIGRRHEKIIKLTRLNGSTCRRQNLKHGKKENTVNNIIPVEKKGQTKQFIQLPLWKHKELLNNQIDYQLIVSCIYPPKHSGLPQRALQAATETRIQI
ncbi:MAG TPA: hypothetical protein VK209_04655 [Candidatus Sulfotelmatobacter sp.]|nr:hypothetical protein [Candidatus Sulfotelmatobacter sp.]